MIELSYYVTQQGGYRLANFLSLPDEKGRIKRLIYKVRGRKKIRPQQFFYNQPGRGFYDFCVQSKESASLIKKVSERIEIKTDLYNKAVR